VTLESPSDDVDGWAVGYNTAVDNSYDPGSENVVAVKLCPNAAGTGFTAMTVTTSSESDYMPDGASQAVITVTDEEGNESESVVDCVEATTSECFKSAQFFVSDQDAKIIGLELTSSDDVISQLGTTDSMLSQGTAYFGDAGCLTSI
jgi:hypothetical protein